MNEMKMKKIAYMIPEFPGQTHTFFWREISAIEKKGFLIEIFSTKLPDASIASRHSWSSRAIQRTQYLHPIREFRFSLIQYSLKKYTKLLKCLKLISTSEDSSLKEKCKLTLYLIYSLKFAKLIEEQNLRHIHSHFCYRASDIAFFASIISGVSYSLSMHGPTLNFGNQINKWKHASFGTVITNKMYHDLSCSPLGEYSKKVKIISMGVDTSNFKRASAYIHPSKELPVKIFCCARLNRSKGQIDLIKLAKELKLQGVRPEIRIAGSESGTSNYLSELKNEISLTKTTNEIYFLGSLTEEEIKDELDHCHIFILPSRNEPLGVAYMEAMSMEVPVIGYNSGGVAELITDGVNGFLCPPLNIECLVQKTLHIINNPELIEQIRKNARLDIESHFDSNHGGIKMADAFTNLDKPNI